MAQLRNTTVDDTGNLSLPSGTTAQRPASPQQGMIRYNTTLNDTEYYDGTAWRSIADTGVEATGGTIIDTEIGGVAYRIHTFTTTGNSTFTVSKGGEVEYLIVAGGGGGGGYVAAAGGGGGGLLTGSTTITPQAYTITVGGGGTAGPVNRSSNGGNGGNSSAFGLTAIGGGGGGRGWSLAAGNSGGSAGGTGGGDGASGAAFLAGTAGTAGQGNAGGGGRRCSNNSGTGGGGGGAGSVGTTPECSPRTAGRGGQGIVSSILGSLQWYAGGGGADSYQPNITEVGGLGGGGLSNGSGILINGTQNTGGGAGSAGNLSLDGGIGGSGIVVIRYRRNASTQVSPTIIIKSSIPNLYAPNAKSIKQAIPNASSGDYWIKVGNFDPILVYCDMENLGGGWMLVGVGREGRNDDPLNIRSWWRNQGDSAAAWETELRSTNRSGSNNYNPRYVPTSWIHAACGGSTWNNIEMVINRIELGDSFYYRTGTGTFNWSTFLSAPAPYSISYSRWTGQWLTSTNSYNFTNTFWTDTLNNGGPVGNDATRLFTWTWGGHSNSSGQFNGWSAGQTVSTPGFQAGSEGHAIQMVNVFVR
jgi:hypothetical protein